MLSWRWDVGERWLPDCWRDPFDLGKVSLETPPLSRNQQRRFAARALSASGDVAFSGEILATLTVGNQSLQIPLAPARNGQTFHMPRVFRIVYPVEIFAGAEPSLAFLRS